MKEVNVEKKQNKDLRVKYKLLIHPFLKCYDYDTKQEAEEAAKKLPAKTLFRIEEWEYYL